MKATRAYAIGIAFGVLLILSPAKALAIPLSDLFQGQTITADDKIFRNWTLMDQQIMSGVFDPTKIDVTPLVDDPLNPGVKFTGAVDSLGTLFGHPGGAFVRVRFSFVVETTTGLPLIKDNSLLINDWIFDSSPNASITISETIRDAAGAPLGDKSVVARAGQFPGTILPSHFDTADFAPTSMVTVEKFIDIVGPNPNDGARLEMFEQRFSQVPEPTALAFAWSVLVWGLAAPRRWCR